MYWPKGKKHTSLKANIEPENHPFEKEKIIFQTSILGLQPWWDNPQVRSGALQITGTLLQEIQVQKGTSPTRLQPQFPRRFSHSQGLEIA